MKRISIYIVLLFVVPQQVIAQYGGGDGRGEITATINSNQLNGTSTNIYGGGNGRGEDTATINSSQLSGITVNVYAGGNGRGEVSTIINSNQLDGASSNIYAGGKGRGEYMADTSSLQLNGVALNIYSGGNGRGEIIAVVNTLQLDGQVENTMFMGGNGRGESIQHFNNTALPVTLLSFSAAQADKNILVQWQTSSELNSAFFVVEKSLDGNSWQPIGKVTAAGQSSVPLSYQLTDTHPVEGTNYYRLKPTDLDGKFAYSPVAIVQYHTVSASKIIIYPNPVKYQFTIALQGSPVASKLHISLVNAQGQTVFEKENLHGNTHTFNISNLASGTYFLVIDYNGQISTSKIVKE